MATVEIYTKIGCSYCARAKALLDSKGVDYRETVISTDPAAREEMLGRANGRTTVPQIFIGGEHIGGSDDLAAVESAGRLDALLSG
ncbi:MAG: hypothetical protein AVDCRST_MAG91-1753 [uncultured Sphingomonadaceae bacterium]|uniref:Glutaredoxin n=1 Tax=uncultured Sphingomonadaceae bacterium TaxID=169976 RepID=A0A6J4T3N3_9SPHN|nr:MAG: hypothetical protein AVDCRST_MAG91-1753 [uncultured Sphingomonadaceae bacterium]